VYFSGEKGFSHFSQVKGSVIKKLGLIGGFSETPSQKNFLNEMNNQLRDFL
jgi:hypothetical protein